MEIRLNTLGSKEIAGSIRLVAVEAGFAPLRTGISKVGSLPLRFFTCSSMRSAVDICGGAAGI